MPARLSSHAFRRKVARLRATPVFERTLGSLRFDHYRHHWRFYFSVLFGILVWLLPLSGTMGIRVSLGGTIFFVIYLSSSAALARSLTTEDLRKKATLEDEGIVVIVVITLAVIALSLGSLVLLLGSGRQAGWMLLPAVINVPLSWATLHTIMAFHYAHLFYSRPDEGGSKAREAGGLDFPKTEEPCVSDFFYYSFVVGMTAQVSDVDVTSQGMRRTTLVHGVVSFFFNTVILALAVNVVAGG